ncbi:MAG: LacI family DNA-binding transcriptional regulator [Melioribacteraceae bacterium]|nr:LacI family DNA-binding transcriptional regulator [Melioribacteraceae bacterium]
MKSTLKDVAKKANLHSSTVSRVLRGEKKLRVSDETRKRVFDAAERLNYSPNQTARTLRMQKSFLIGLIVPDIANPFFARVVRSIEQQGFERGYTVIVCNTDENQDKEDKFIDTLLSRGIDGLIIAPVQDSTEQIQKLVDRNFPVVLFDRCFCDIEMNAVLTNNLEASYDAVKILANKGSKRVAFVSGRRGIYTTQQRLEGYQKAVKDFHLDKSESLIAGDGFSFESGYEATKQLLKLADPPTSMIVTGNLVSVGAMKAVLDAGLSIPNDISIIAFSDNIFSQYLVTPLSSIIHPIDEIGLETFKILIKNIDSKEKLPFEKKMINSTLELRDSV